MSGVLGPVATWPGKPAPERAAAVGPPRSARWSAPSQRASAVQQTGRCGAILGAIPGPLPTEDDLDAAITRLTVDRW